MPPSVTLTLFEPVTYLRGQSTTLDSSRERLRSAFSLNGGVNGESQPSQLRGLVTVTLPKPTRIKSVELVLSGIGRTDWPEGIGSNRLELADIAPIIKEEVVLFDARAEDAPAAPLRRANSVGPGVTGFGDDVDWSLMGDDAGASSSHARGKGKERETPNLARSMGKAAAKAGSAILPPTLLREIANTRPDKNRASRSDPSPASPMSIPRNDRAPGHISPSASRSPSANHEPPPPMYQPRRQSSDTLSATGVRRLSAQDIQEPSASSSQTSLPPSTPPSQAASSATSLSSTSAAGPGTLSPTTSFASTPAGPTLPSQSVSAAGPHGRSILHAPRRGRSPPPIDGAPMSARIVETASSCDARPRVREANEPSVRFDPKDLCEESADQAPLSPVASREQIRTSYAESGSNGYRASPSPGPRQTKREPSASAPTSRRTSFDALANALEVATKGKGKGKASGDSSPKIGLTPQKKSGLKGLLGGLRKDEGSSKNRSEAGSPAASQASAARRRSLDHSSPAPPARAVSSDRLTSMNLSHAPHQPPQFNSPALCDWREFKKGVYSYSVSLPLPANLPPTIHADFGSNTYTLKAVVRRPGALTPNLSCEKEVVLIHAPDEEGGEETDSIVVERTWEEALTYRVFVSGRSFACGSKIPLCFKFIPLGEKIRIWRLNVVLEEKTHYYAKRKKIARHETPRRFNLLKLSPTNASGEASTSTAVVDLAATRPLLPIVSDSADALMQSPLGQYAVAAARLNLPAQVLAQANEARENDESNDSEVEPLGDEARQDALATLLDPGGPWELSMDVDLPGKDSRINTSTDHKRSNITVEHVLRMSFRVEKARPGAPVGGKPMLFDIVIESPVTINHSHTADAWLSLPNYWAVANVQPPTSAAAGSSSFGFGIHAPTQSGSRSVPVPGSLAPGGDGKARYVPESEDYFASSHYRRSKSNTGRGTSPGFLAAATSPNSGRCSPLSSPPIGASSSRAISPGSSPSASRVTPGGGGGGGISPAEGRAGPAGAEFRSAADEWLHLSEERWAGPPTSGIGIGMVMDSMSALNVGGAGAGGVGAGVGSSSGQVTSEANGNGQGTSSRRASLVTSGFQASMSDPASAFSAEEADADRPPSYAVAVHRATSPGVSPGNGR